jgi:hypothetical protein
MRTTLAVTCLVIAAASAATAGTDVQLSVGGLLSIRAADAPLREILDRIEDKTGMKTIYDGIPPSQHVTVTLADLTPAVAIAELLEGRGVRFAMSTDRVGAKVVTLFLTTVQVEIKALPPPSPFEVSMPPEMSEAMQEGRPTDELPPWLPQRPSWWPKVGEKNAEASPGESAPAAPVPAAAPSNPNLLPTPAPYAVSPFTPQGPGPILLALPGAAPPPPQDPSQPMSPASIPPVPALAHPNPSAYTTAH